MGSDATWRSRDSPAFDRLHTSMERTWLRTRPISKVTIKDTRRHGKTARKDGGHVRQIAVDTMDGRTANCSRDAVAARGAEEGCPGRSRRPPGEGGRRRRTRGRCWCPLTWSAPHKKPSQAALTRGGLTRGGLRSEDPLEGDELGGHLLKASQARHQRPEEAHLDVRQAVPLG